MPAINRTKKVLTLFGTRPEVIKLAPVIQELQARPDCFTTINVSSSQHTDLLHPLIRDFALRLDHDLKVMQPNQTLSSLSARSSLSFSPARSLRDSSFASASSFSGVSAA